MIVNPDATRLYDSRGLMPHLSALMLPPTARLEVVADIVQAQGVLCARTFPAAEVGRVAVVWGLEADGASVVIYLK